jgi:hypothetical protein
MSSFAMRPRGRRPGAFAPSVATAPTVFHTPGPPPPGPIPYPTATTTTASAGTSPFAGVFEAATKDGGAASATTSLSMARLQAILAGYDDSEALRLKTLTKDDDNDDDESLAKTW